jgi:hypothetical protein
MAKKNDFGLVNQNLVWWGSTVKAVLFLKWMFYVKVLIKIF